MFSKNNKDFQFIIIFLLIIILLNISSILSDRYKSQDYFFEIINSKIYYPLSPIFLELLNKFNEGEDNILLFGCDDNNKNIKLYLFLKENQKTIDDIIYASFFKFENLIIFIDDTIKDKTSFINQLVKKQKNEEYTKIYLKEQNKIIFKAHFIREAKGKKNFLYSDSDIEARIKRAIKERSCMVILNLTNKKLNEEMKIKIINSSFFIFSFKKKLFLYRIIGIIAIVINLIFIRYIQKNYSLFISKHFELLIIINSIFLLIYYIISIIIEINSKISSILTTTLQATFCALEFFYLIYLAKKLTKQNNLDNIIKYLSFLLILSFLTGLTINTIFFTDKVLWLKPKQYLVYFFYFLPAILLVIMNFQNEKKYLLFYLLIFLTIYILSKARDYGYFLTMAEMKIRNFIETYLPVRFRFREFIFYFAGFLALYIIFFLTNKNEQRYSLYFENRPLRLFKYLNTFASKHNTITCYFILYPFLTIINSYYHSYTPIYLSFLRTIFAIFFGFILSFFISVIYIAINKLIKVNN